MKKKIIISAIAVLIIGLFVPIPKAYADGTKSYNAVAYKIVKWNRPYYKNLMFTEKEVYKFPHSLKSVDEIWEGMAIDPAVSEVSGVVVDAAENGASVEVVEGDGIISPGEIIEIPSDENLKTSEAVRVEYVPDYSKGKDNKIGKIVDVEKESKTTERITEKETTVMFEDSAVYFKSTNECKQYIIPKKTQLSYDKDAGTVNEIIGRYKFKTDPYDNIPDYEITIGNSVLYYDSSSGIVTDSVVKKTNAEKSIVLNKSDREAINSLIRKYSISEQPTVKPTMKSTEPVRHTKAPDDSFHFIRISWNSSADYPQVVFIRNRAQYESLSADMNADSYDSNNAKELFNKKYNDKFFKDKALVVVFTDESSGSDYYTDVKINSNANEIYITRYIPEVRTCDMASWVVIKEVSASDPILTKDNTKTAVLKTE